VRAIPEPALPEAVTSDTAAKPHYRGHRDRLRQRFLSRGPEALDDYELLELLLFSAFTQADVKPLAKELLAVCGTLWEVVSAPPAKLRKVSVCVTKPDGGQRRLTMTDTAIAAVTIVGAAALRMTRQQVLNRPVLSSWKTLLEYCEGSMAHEATEQFRLLFLDRKNVLIADEVQQRGTVDHTPVYPREVVKRALELGASALILVHNHPSGDPTPSRADIEMTKQIAAAAQALGLTVHDHLIIGRGKHASFRSMGLL